MIGKSLSRNELKGINGGAGGCGWDDPFKCLACTSSCLYDPFGPGAGCPPGGNCVLIECPSMWSCCSEYEQYRYRAVCDWEV
jgi:hypothetical protein